MQSRAGSQPKPNIYICPNCRVKINPDTQICPNCKTRICTYCYLAIPSVDARVCPNCGKHEVLKKPLSQLLVSAAEEKGSAEYFESETEYKCPRCKSKLLLRSNRRLSCKNCGFITSLDDFLSSTRKPNPFYDVRGTIASKERISSQLPDGEAYSSSGQYKVPEKLTTHFEAKADNQKWWKKKGIAGTAPVPNTRRKNPPAQVFIRDGKSSSRADYKKLAMVFKIIGIIILLALIGYGIYLGVGKLLAFTGSINISRTITGSKAEFRITSPDVNSITENGAIVIWQTDEPATSQVQYGSTPILGNKYENDDLVTEHSLVLSNLEADTTYYYKVVSQTDDGRIDTLQSQFTTLAPPDTVPPTISGINVTSITDVEAEILYTTDENAYSVIDYGTSTDYSNTVKVNSDLTQQHLAKLANLSADTTYHFRVTVFDTKDNSAQSQEMTFKTLQPIKVGYKLYNRAPDFTLQSLSGEIWTLSDLRGRLVMINFWNLSCGPCRAELPDIDTIYKTWQGNKPLQLLTINLGDYRIHLENAVAQNGYTFPILLDESGISYKYGISTIPVTFFIDTSGIIQKIQNGRFKSADEIRLILNSL